MEKHKKNVKIPYQDKLNMDARGCYLAKLSTINNTDPYDLTGNNWSSNFVPGYNKLPCLWYQCIYICTVQKL